MNKILSFGWVNFKWFKRLRVKELLEFLGDAMKHVIIEDILLEALRVMWQVAKMSNLEYCIANINPLMLAPNKEKKC